jgi:DNA-binding LacI/PurR family transcriptional regulator
MPDLAEAARQLIGTGYSLSISAADSRSTLDAIFDELSGPGRAAGVISFGARPRTRDLARFRRSRIPFVVFGDRVEGSACVSVDEQRAGRLAVETLTRSGHRSIGFVAGRKLAAFVHDATVGRHLGYAAAVNAHRSIVRRSHVVRTIEGPEGADNALRRLLAKDDPPTAIVAATDETATAVMAAQLRRGLSVPRDMSLLGIGGPTWITHIVAADPGPARVAIGLALDQAGYGGTNAPVQMELGVRLVDAATTSPP